MNFADSMDYSSRFSGMLWLDLKFDSVPDLILAGEDFARILIKHAFTPGTFIYLFVFNVPSTVRSRELNPGPSRGSPLPYRCTTQAPHCR